MTEENVFWIVFIILLPFVILVLLGLGMIYFQIKVYRAIKKYPLLRKRMSETIPTLYPDKERRKKVMARAFRIIKHGLTFGSFNEKKHKEAVIDVLNFNNLKIDNQKINSFIEKYVKISKIYFMILNILLIVIFSITILGLLFILFANLFLLL